MRILKSRHKQLAIGLCCILAAFATTKAEDIPTLSAIVSDVAKATMPSRNYSASVHQKIFQANVLASPATKVIPTSALISASTNEIEEADFTLNGETTGAFRVTKAVSLKRMLQSTNVASKAAPPTQNMRLMLTVNPMNALRHIEKLNSATITSDLYQGIACFKLSATDDRFGFVVWVNKTNSAVCRQIILQDFNTLLETDFEYKKWNGFTPIPERLGS